MRADIDLGRGIRDCLHEEALNGGRLDAILPVSAEQLTVSDQPQI